MRFRCDLEKSAFKGAAREPRKAENSAYAVSRKTRGTGVVFVRLSATLSCAESHFSYLETQVYSSYCIFILKGGVAWQVRKP